jgi:hypothetical protein
MRQNRPAKRRHSSLVIGAVGQQSIAAGQKMFKLAHVFLGWFGVSGHLIQRV